MSRATVVNQEAGPVRLVLLLQDLAFGGTQRYALHLLRGLDRTLFAPELWLMNAGDDLLEEARATGAPVTSLSDLRPGHPLAVLRLARRLRRERPALLYTLTVVPNIWGRLLGRLYRVPAVVSGFRNLDPRQWEKSLWRLSDRIICNSALVRERVIRVHGVPPERIAMVPNAVDCGLFQSAEAEPGPVVLFLGRLVVNKDPETLLEAFARLAPARPGARLVMAGDGPLRPALEARIKALGLEDRVTLMPATSEVRTLLARARIFALPSAWEGSPNVLLEAMAMGLPVVATPVGGVAELVVPEKTGLLVPPGDANALAEALARLLDDPKQARTMGRAGRERACDEYGLPSMLRATEQVLLEALERARTRAKSRGRSG